MDNTADKIALEQLQKEFDEFSYIVSHDLKAPLRAVDNISMWIEEDFGENIDPEIKENFKLLRNRVERMKDMIDVLNDHSRVNRRELDIVDVDIVEVLTEIKEEIQEVYPNASVELNLEPQSIRTFKNKFYKVLNAIVQNAAMHTKENVKIEVTTETINETLQLTIKDNGVGIPDDLQEEVFKLFYTLEPKDKSKTIGAGLTLAKKIIQFVGGTIQLESKLNEGTEVTINWPLKNK